MDANTAYQRGLRSEDIEVIGVRDDWYVIYVWTKKMIFSGDLYDCCWWASRINRWEEEGK